MEKMGKYTRKQTVKAFRITKILLRNLEDGSEYYQIEGERIEHGERRLITDKNWMSQNNVQVGDWYVCEINQNASGSEKSRCVKPEDFHKNYCAKHARGFLEAPSEFLEEYVRSKIYEAFCIQEISLNKDGSVSLRGKNSLEGNHFSKKWMKENNVQVGGYIAYESSPYPNEIVFYTKDYEYISEEEFSKEFVHYNEPRDQAEVQCP